MSSRDLVEGNSEDEKTPHPLEILRERARILLDTPLRDRTITPQPRSSLLNQ